MRKWVWAAIVCSIALPESALATVYDFKSTEASALGDPTYSFALDTANAVNGASGTSFAGVTIDDSGVVTTGNTVTLSGPAELGGPSFFFIDTDVPGPKPFAAGSGVDTTFNPGTFSIADGFNDGEGTLTISNAAVSAAPEPSTWSLMIAAVSGIGFMLRRAKKRTSLGMGTALRP